MVYNAKTLSIHVKLRDVTKAGNTIGVAWSSDEPVNNTLSKGDVRIK